MVLNMVIFSIPEALVVSWLANALIGGKLRWWYILCTGFVTGMIIALVRPHLSYFPVVVILYAILLLTSFTLFKIASIWKIVVSVIFAIPLYLLTEFVNIISMRILSIDPSSFPDNPRLKFICFVPQLLATALIALYFTVTKASLFLDGNNSKTKEV